MSRPMLLLTAPDEIHVFDAYLDEILLTEGYNVRDSRPAGPEPSTPIWTRFC